MELVQVAKDSQCRRDIYALHMEAILKKFIQCTCAVIFVKNFANVN